MMISTLVVSLLMGSAPVMPAADSVSRAPGEPAAVRWGAHGHRWIGEAAVRALPAEMPAFFRDAVDQLAYLNPEPDRWRAREERALDPAMDAAHVAEHYINFEPLPPGALRAPHRFAYLDSLRVRGLDTPGPGLLPYRILELTQRVRLGFRQWRAATDPQERAWIEARIINDAGILGHYVADGSNPHHTTVHFNGWVGPNPRGYTTDRTFHSRFESVFVQHRMNLDAVRSAMAAPAQVFPDVRAAVWDYLGDSHRLVETLYELELREPFGPETRSPEHHRFAAQRLAAGAEMLRDLWWTAWATSAGDAARSPSEVREPASLP
jgi:hypothetical protein